MLNLGLQFVLFLAGKGALAPDLDTRHAFTFRFRSGND